MNTIQTLLKQLRACDEAQKYFANASTIEEVVKTCPRGDWGLWLASRLNVDKRLLTLTAGHCANTVRHLMKDPRSIAAVDAAIAFGEGRIGVDELEEARKGARDADNAAAASAASAASSAAYAAYADTYTANLLATADICRKYLSEAIINEVNKRLQK